MSATACSLLWLSQDEERDYSMADFEKAQARWCPGCGDFSILASVQRLMASEGLTPETTVFVSGIGCSSRFPHYVNSYGFHGLHGRALPVATGVKLNRPDKRNGLDLEDLLPAGPVGPKGKVGIQGLSVGDKIPLEDLAPGPIELTLTDRSGRTGTFRTVVEEGENRTETVLLE